MTPRLLATLESYQLALGRHMRIELLRNPRLVDETNRDVLRIVTSVLVAVAARTRGAAPVGFAAALMTSGAVPGPRAAMHTRLLRPTRLLQIRRDSFDQ